MSLDNKIESSYRLTRLFYRRASTYNTYIVVSRDEYKDQTINLRYDSLVFLINKELPEYFREGSNYEFTSDCTYVPICKVLETLKKLKEEEGEWIRFSLKDFRCVCNTVDPQYIDLLYEIQKEGDFIEIEKQVECSLSSFFSGGFSSLTKTFMIEALVLVSVLNFYALIDRYVR